jgi:hypothetical protein
MEMLLILAILGAVVAAIVIGGFFALIALTCLIYVISHVYPWLRRIAVWCARPENLFAFLILAIVLIILIVIVAILLRFTLLLILIIYPLLLFLPVYLGIVVWIIRLIRWLYSHYSDWIAGLYTAIRLQIIKFKINVDMQKETDWKVKWSETKKKLSEEAEQARRNISRRGK